MKKTFYLLLAVVVALLLFALKSCDKPPVVVTPTPVVVTNTPVAPTATNTPVYTLTPTTIAPTPTITPTKVITPTLTLSPTRIIAPLPTLAPTPTITPTTPNQDILHTLIKGDTYWVLAKVYTGKYENWQMLKVVNGWDERALPIGAVVRIPQ